MLLLNNGLCFVMRLVTKLDAVHLADTIVQKRKQSKHGTGEQGNRMDDLIDRQAAIEAIMGEPTDAHYPSWYAERLEQLPSAHPEIIHCWECIYYDPEHIEKNGVRYEYEDMPKDAFDILGTGLVNSEYGINVGGRCCRDYNVGYSEDKRVFVSKQNYCGRAERKTDE